MQLLAWSDALKTHIDVIDRQHRGLVDLVNATAAKLADEALSAEEVRLLLGYLKEYAEIHFGTEEALMALCGLPPGYANRHHQNHARFLAHVGDMLDGLGDDPVVDGRQLLAFLGDWLIRHIQGEDRGLAQRLHAARLEAASALGAGQPVGDVPAVSGPEYSFADALALGSAALHESEAQVLALVEENEHAALVISLESSLMPAKVLHANAAAAALLGRDVEGLIGAPAATLLGAGQSGRFPVLMSEVLVSGQFEGLLDYAGPGGKLRKIGARVTYMGLHGQMVILVVFDSPVGEEGAAESAPEPALAARAGLGVASLGPGRTVLSRHPLFVELTRSELAGVERASGLIRLGKGDILYRKGEHATDLFMVISGQMALAASNDRGAEKILDIVDPQQVFGEVEVLTGGAYRTTARSLTQTVLLSIPAAAVRKLQASSLRFARAAVEHIGKRLLEVKGEIEALTLHTAMERIIDHLLEHATVNGHGILEAMLPAQKQVIASYLNLSPPTLSRAFQQLGDAGLITVSRRYVTIPDRERLLRFRAQEAAG